MSYSCSDFVDTILDALGVQNSEEIYDDPSAQADLALAAIQRLRDQINPRGVGRLSRQGIRKRTRAVEPMDLQRIGTALDTLRDARAYLRDAQAHHAADYVSRAVKSAEGALNHAERMAAPDA